MLALTTILTIFGSPETKWDRPFVRRQLAAVGQQKEELATNLVEGHDDRNTAAPKENGSNGSLEPEDMYLGRGV